MALVGGRPVGRARVRPAAGHERAVPAADPLRPNEQVLPAVARKQVSEAAEYDPVGQIATRSSDLPTEHHQFVAQHEDLDRVPVVRSAT
jgi:hypothetical protein